MAEAKKPNRCFAKSCSNYQNEESKASGISFHRFPDRVTDSEHYEAWVRYCQRQEDPSPESVLCSAHFERECFNREGEGCELLPDAKPTITQIPQQDKDTEKIKAARRLKTIATVTSLVVGGAVGGALVATVAIPAALGVAGFGAAGVVAGSAAAAWQAAIGNVAAGSLFAILQSAGAGGMTAAIAGTGAAAGATAGGAAGIIPKLVKKVKSLKKKPESDK